MVFFQFFQKFAVCSGCEPRVYERRRESERFLYCGGDFFTFLIEVAERDYCGFFAFLLNFEGVERIECFFCGAVGNSKCLEK